MKNSRISYINEQKTSQCEASVSIGAIHPEPTSYKSLCLMRIPVSYYSSMCQRLNTRRMLFPEDFHFPSRGPSTRRSAPSKPLDTVYESWLASRQMPGQKGSYLVPGTQRPLNSKNAKLALSITHQCAYDLVEGLMQNLLFSVINIIFTVKSTLALESSPNYTYDDTEHCTECIPSIPRILPGKASLN